MDANQRLSYPQIARGGAFDAAVFGTSTARLLDPDALDAAFGGRFANLAVNAATPDEQIRLAGLFLAHRPVRAVLFGLDATVVRRRPAVTDGQRVPRLALRGGHALGLAAADEPPHRHGRVQAGLARMGLARPRIRRDGYAVFTPPEDRYDPERARAHIRAGAADPAAPRDAPEPPCRPSTGWTISSDSSPGRPEAPRLHAGPCLGTGRARARRRGARGGLQGARRRPRRGHRAPGGGFPPAVAAHQPGRELLGRAALSAARGGAHRGGPEGGRGDRRRRSRRRPTGCSRSP